MGWTTDDLINAVKNSETIPDSGAAYSSPTLLQFLNFGMNQVVGAIMTMKQSYFDETYDVTLSLTGVNNVVNIPATAAGLTINDVSLVGSDGSFISLPRITQHQAAAQSMSWGYGTQAITNSVFNNGLRGYFIQGNQIQLFPYNIATGAKIRVSFVRYPNYLCLTTDAAQIVSITGDVVQVSNVPTWIGGQTQLCAVSQQAPHPFVIDATQTSDWYCTPPYLNDFISVGISGNVITLPAGISGNMQVGDWICLSNQSVYAMNIPPIFYPAIIQYAGALCIHAAGDADGNKMAMESFNTMLKQSILQISERASAQPVKALSGNSAFKASRRRSFGLR